MYICNICILLLLEHQGLKDSAIFSAQVALKSQVKWWTGLLQMCLKAQEGRRHRIWRGSCLFESSDAKSGLQLHISMRLFWYCISIYIIHTHTYICLIVEIDRWYAPVKPIETKHMGCFWCKLQSATASTFTPVHWGHHLGSGIDYHMFNLREIVLCIHKLGIPIHLTLFTSSPVLQAWTMLLEYLFVSEDVERRTSNLNCNPPEEQPANYEQASSQAELVLRCFFFCELWRLWTLCRACVSVRRRHSLNLGRDRAMWPRTLPL